MSRLIYVFLSVIAVIAIVTMMFPVLLVVFGLGLIYTIVMRYRLLKEVQASEKMQQEFYENIEERQSNLEVIEAEFEERK